MTDTTIQPTTASPETTTDLTPKDPSASVDTAVDRASPKDPVDPANPVDPAAPKDETPKDPEAPDPEKLRLTVPETADGYTVNLADDAKAALGLVENDPMVSALAKFAHENGKPQGWVDDALEAASALAAQGLFDGGFDPAAEVAKLGENGPARQREVELFAEALKTRGDLDEEMFGDLMSLAPTAGGVKLVEWFRKNMGDAGVIQTGGQVTNVEEAAKQEARQMAKDPRYRTDRAFRAEADRKWVAAFKNG